MVIPADLQIANLHYKTRTIAKPERSKAPHSKGGESETELVANHSQCEEQLLKKAIEIDVPLLTETILRPLQ